MGKDSIVGQIFPMEIVLRSLTRVHVSDKSKWMGVLKEGSEKRRLCLIRGAAQETEAAENLTRHQMALGHNLQWHRGDAKPHASRTEPIHNNEKADQDLTRVNSFRVNFKHFFENISSRCLLFLMN